MKCGSTKFVSHFAEYFCILLLRDSTLYVFNDFLGTYKIFHDDDFNFVSTSFLALLEILEEKTISEQEFYEYILTGGVYGDATFINEIGVLKRSTVFNLTEKQYEIDFTFNLNFAKKAKENGIESYVLVSSVGANAKSGIFYTRMKGELDESVSKIGFKKCQNKT